MRVAPRKRNVLLLFLIVVFSGLIGLELSSQDSVALSIVHTIAYILLGFCVFCLVITKSKVIELHDSTMKLKEVLKQNKSEIAAMQGITIEMMVEFSKLSNVETADHLNKIKRFVRIIANELMKESVYSCYLQEKSQYVEDLVLASGLHDIGKYVIPESILNKAGKLSEAEFSIIQKHTTYAGQILAQGSYLYNSPNNPLTLAYHIASCHHECWDGSGYPGGMSGKEIPLSARIVAIADVYDALTSARCYKGAWSHEDAIIEISSLSGVQFDPDVTAAFLAVEKQIKMASLF